MRRISEVPGADLVELGVAQQPSGRIVVDIAVAAEQLDRIERRPRRRLGAEQNAGRGILARGVAAVAGRRHHVGIAAAGIQRGVHVGELALHEFEGADRLAELLALAHVRDGHIERGAP